MASQITTNSVLEEVFAFNDKSGPVTLSQLAKAMSKKAPALRYHMVRLVDQGYLSTDTRPPVGKGRPAFLYTVTEPGIEVLAKAKAEAEAEAEVEVEVEVVEKDDSAPFPGYNDFTVREVQAYIREAATSDIIESIMGFEDSEQGKGRKGVIDYASKHLAKATA